MSPAPILLIPTNSSVINCYTDIVIEGSSNTGVGGIVGASGVGTLSITNSYVAGDVYYYGNATGILGGILGGVLGTHTSGSNPVGCIALNKRLENINGGMGTIRFFGNADTATGISETYYNKNVISPEGTNLYCSSGGLYANSIPINPYTISRTSAPFNTWNFTNVWMWDDTLNRPELRRVGRR